MENLGTYKLKIGDFGFNGEREFNGEAHQVIEFSTYEEAVKKFEKYIKNNNKNCWISVVDENDNLWNLFKNWNKPIIEEYYDNVDHDYIIEAGDYKPVDKFLFVKEKTIIRTLKETEKAYKKMLKKTVDDDYLYVYEFETKDEQIVNCKPIHIRIIWDKN